jgi:hypothetical protein
MSEVGERGRIVAALEHEDRKLFLYSEAERHAERRGEGYRL